MVKTVIPLETKQILARSMDIRDAAEFKKIRRVRTRAGALVFRQPIGSIIVRDAVLPNLKIKKPVFDGFETVEAPNGKLYDLGKDDDGKWTAFLHDTNRRYATAMDEESLFQVVNDKVGRRKAGRAKKPAEPAPEVRGGEELARVFFRGDRARFRDADTGKMTTLPVVNSGRKRKGRLQQEYVTVERPDGSRETFWEEDFPDIGLTRSAATLAAPEKAPEAPKKRGLGRFRPGTRATQSTIDDYERQGKYGTANAQEAFRLEMHQREWMNPKRLEAIQESETYRNQLASAIFATPDQVASFARAEAGRLKRENKPGARESVIGAARRATMVANKPRQVAIERRQARSQAAAAERTAAARVEQAAKPKKPATERVPDAYEGRFGRDEFGTVAREGDMQGASDDLASGKRVDWAKYSPDQLRWLHQNLQDRLEAGEVDVATVSKYKRNMDAELRRRAQNAPRRGTPTVVPPRRSAEPSAPAAPSIDQLSQAINTLKGRYGDMTTAQLRTALSQVRNNTNNQAQIVVQAIEEILAERGVSASASPRSSGRSLKAKYDEFRNNGWFDDYPTADEVVRARSSLMKKLTEGGGLSDADAKKIYQRVLDQRKLDDKDYLDEEDAKIASLVAKARAQGPAKRKGQLAIVNMNGMLRVIRVDSVRGGRVTGNTIDGAEPLYFEDDTQVS